MIEEYVIIINQESKVSHHKCTLLDEDMDNANHRTFCSCGFNQ